MKDKAGRELRIGEVGEKSVRRAKSITSEFIIMLLHCVGQIPSHQTRRFFYRASGMKIGKGSTIHMGARFYNVGDIHIGEDTIIGEDVVLDGRDAIRIGSHVAIASDVMIYNAEHNIHDKDFQVITEPVEIGNYVFIGPRAILLPGVRIGRGAVIAAGAVVTKNVEELAIVGGVPAKKIGERHVQELSYKIGRAAWFR